jgi:mRNA (guanine-N7-)-methyltransferase
MHRKINNLEIIHGGRSLKCNMWGMQGLSHHIVSGFIGIDVISLTCLDNARPEVGLENREFSPIIGLKKFNNWIKSVLIGKFAFRPKHGEAGANVLDLGCGKGGDLNKWRQAKIGLYVGLGMSAHPYLCSSLTEDLDIAATSIDQARERYSKLYRPGFEGFFFAYDCFAVRLPALPLFTVRADSS